MSALNRTLKQTAGGLAVALLLTLAGGCAPAYDRTQLVGEAGAGVSYQLGAAVEVPEGIALGVTATPLDTGGNPWPEPERDAVDEFDLRSENPAILEVIRVPDQEEDIDVIDLTRDPAPIHRTFIFAAHQLGSTALLITLGGEVVDRIPAQVVPQSAE